MNAEAIDRTFSLRFPNRQFWLRPATPPERAAIHAVHEVPPAATACIALAKRGSDYLAVPFLSLSTDISDATESAAAQVITVAVEAIHAGTLAMIAPMRSGS